MSAPILIWQPEGGVSGGPITSPPVYSQAGTTQLVEGQAYIDVVFGSIQTTDEWVLVECVVVNELDVDPLNIWPGIITDKTAAGFRIQLNGMPDSGNYYLHWAVSGINITPSPATTYYLSGPATGGIHVDSTAFTVSLPPSTTVSGTLTVTPDDGGTGTFTPSSVTLTSSSRTATFVYTPDTYGAVTISATNSGGLIDPASISFTCVATGYGMTGPSSGSVGVASTDFTVDLPGGGVVVGTVTVTPDDGSDGAFTPTTVALTTAAPSATFTYTPASAGAKTISVTNDGGLTNPGNLTYTVTAPMLAQDTFTDTDGTLLTAHTMDVGLGWFKFEGTVPNQVTIQSNKVLGYSDGGSAYGYITEGTNADCVVQATGVINYATAGLQYVGVVFRWSGIVDYWVVWIHKDGSNNVELTKYVSNVPTVVATGTLAITVGAGIVIQVTLSGSSISVLADATLVTATDSFNSTATKHGIRFYWGAGATGPTFDDFTVQ